MYTIYPYTRPVMWCAKFHFFVLQGSGLWLCLFPESLQSNGGNPQLIGLWLRVPFHKKLVASDSDRSAASVSVYKRLPGVYVSRLVFFWSGHGTLNKFSLHFSSSALSSAFETALRRSTLQKAPAAAPQKPPPRRSWPRRAETMEGTEAEILRKPHVSGGKMGATWVYQYTNQSHQKRIYIRLMFDSLW